jgi:hypothetical protein
MKFFCPKCKVTRTGCDRCLQCGYKIPTSQERDERMGRIARNSLIGFVTALTGIWLFRLL